MFYTDREQQDDQVFSFLTLINDLDHSVQDPIAYLYFAFKTQNDPCHQRRKRVIECKYSLALVKREIKAHLLRRTPPAIDTFSDLDAYCDADSGVLLTVAVRMENMENMENIDNLTLSHQMLRRFLQRVDCIANVQFDNEKMRYFWPKALWSQFVPSVTDLCDVNHVNASVACMNRFIYETLLMFHEGELIGTSTTTTTTTTTTTSTSTVTLMNRLVLVCILLLSHMYDNPANLGHGQKHVDFCENQWHDICSCKLDDYKIRLRSLLYKLQQKCVHCQHQNLYDLLEKMIVQITI